MLVMQALKDVWNEFKIKKVYNTDREDAIKNFYVPLLRNTKNYWRESGYFSSGSFAIAAIGFLEFMENGGKMQLIVVLQTFQLSTTYLMTEARLCGSHSGVCATESPTVTSQATMWKALL